MIYLDANVFAYAALDGGKLGDKARNLLGDVQAGRVEASSSALSFDELVWAVKRNRTMEDSLKAGEAFLNMPGLKLIETDEEVLAKALEVMKSYRLDPRDAIHAASALSSGSTEIISADPHFDPVKEIRRRKISETKRRS